jgi:flagellar hook-basal body complex protein FliE
MSDLTVNGLRPIAPLSPGTKPAAGGAGGDDFAAMLRGQLEQVSRMQSEADEDLKRLMAGQSDSVTDVLVTARKADVAFSLLMEIRNKLVDAYQELQNMRV